MPAAKTRIGFYSGSFDPVTLGHTDVIRRAAQLVDALVIGIGVNPGKAPMFTDAERVAMLEDEVKADRQGRPARRISVVTFSGLAVDAARTHKASVIFRGLRDGTDFDYEMQMSGMNGEMAPEIQTVFVSASPQVRHIAANLVRAVASMGGDASPFVSKAVLKRLKAKAAKKRLRLACMATPPAERRIKSRIAGAWCGAVPVGRVVTCDLLARELGVLPMVIVDTACQPDGRRARATPWHRVVAKGGAIGRGPHRDAQFAQLVREGVPVSPAGIVQDMGRVAVDDVAR